MHALGHTRHRKNQYISFVWVEGKSFLSASEMENPGKRVVSATLIRKEREASPGMSNFMPKKLGNLSLSLLHKVTSPLPNWGKLWHLWDRKNIDFSCPFVFPEFWCKSQTWRNLATTSIAGSSEKFHFYGNWKRVGVGISLINEVDWNCQIS